MVIIIEHEHISPDGLSKREWQYWFNDSHKLLQLRYYAGSERPTKRHGWKRFEWWDFYKQRSSTMNRDDVDIPDSVREAVRAKFLEQITID